MKPRKKTSSKPKLNFSVDRSEFDISSDWVQAVMADPPVPPRKPPFFSDEKNNATDVSNATVADVIPVAHPDAAAENTAGANKATVAESATDHETASIVAPAAERAPNLDVAASATVAGFLGVPAESFATVANNATVVHSQIPRHWKRRPLVRLTDGLTPGQFAVYTVMFSNAEAGQGGEKIYRGGYADIGRLTGLSKRGIQNVIAELQEKAVIHLHTAPGHHRLQTSAYAVPDAAAIIVEWHNRGWRFAVGKSKKLIDGATVALL